MNNVIAFRAIEKPPAPPQLKHVWGPSRLDHGDAQCVHCSCTDREARFALGPICPTRKI